MHTRGTRMRVDFDIDGQEECGADVDRWDFDWQQTFFYEEPIAMRMTDIMRVSCEWNTEGETEPVGRASAPKARSASSVSSWRSAETALVLRGLAVTARTVAHAQSDLVGPRIEVDITHGGRLTGAGRRRRLKRSRNSSFARRNLLFTVPCGTPSASASSLVVNSSQ